MAVSAVFFQDAAPTPEVIIARLSLLLHKLPDEIRQMSMDDVDLVLYMVKCENHKQQQDSRINSEMSKMK